MNNAIDFVEGASVRYINKISNTQKGGNLLNDINWRISSNIPENCLVMVVGENVEIFKAKSKVQNGEQVWY